MKTTRWNKAVAFMAALLIGGTLLGQGKAVQLDGVDDRMWHSSSIGFLSDAANSRTISMWVKITQAAPTVTAATDGTRLIAADNVTTWALMVANVNSAGNKVYALNNTEEVAVDYTVNTWMHLAYVHDGTDLSLYKDGILSGTIASATCTDIGGWLSIGSKGGGGPFLACEVDEYQIWNVPLTATQVIETGKRDMTEAVVGTDGTSGITDLSWSDLKLYRKFEDNNSDSSSNAGSPGYYSYGVTEYV